MKKTSLWLRGVCLIWLLVLGASLKPAHAQDSSVPIPLLPKYMVLGVVYAPPGSASSVTYGKSTSVGASNAITNSSSSSDTLTTSFSINGSTGLGEEPVALGTWSFTGTTSTSDNWTSTSTDGQTLSVQTSNGNSITTLGPISSSLGVNHDNDVIYILLNPVLLGDASLISPGNFGVDFTGILANSCNLADSNVVPTLYQKFSGCDPNQFPYPDIIGIPVWCLKNPYYPGQGCAQWLPYTSRSWDKSYRGPADITATQPYPTDPTNTPALTLQDYADILRADPFVQQNGSYTHPCHPTYGPNLDPNDPEILGGAPNFITKSDGTAGPAPSGSVFTVQVIQGGEYFSAPTVYFNSSIGSGAAGFANMLSVPGQTYLKVGSVTITNGGQGYQTAPLVTFDSGAVTATATAYIPSSPTNCGAPVNTVINRFKSYGTVEFPVPGPNGLPSTYSGQFSHSLTDQTETTAFDSHTSGVSFDLTAKYTSPGFSVFGGYSLTFSAGNSQSNTMTWQQSNTSTTTTSNTADYSITGPQLSDNYTGPATYNVYVDNIYGTYAFYSDLSPKINLGTIGIASTGLSSTIPVLQPFSSGNSPTTATITLTNISDYPLTMVGPAVTFNDPSFFIVQDGSDGCSNKYLPNRNNSCTLKIGFTPTTADAWNPITNPTAEIVNATMIAAGTESASPYQNILVTSTAAVMGDDTTQAGDTLIANDSSITVDNPIPNIYDYSTSVGGAATSEVFTFTNYEPSGVTLLPPTASATSPVTLADSVNFHVSSTTCNSSVILTAGQTCTVTLQFTPAALATNAPTQLFDTIITVSGYVGTASSKINTLATAGAVGIASAGMTVSPSNPESVAIQPKSCPPGHSDACVGFGATFTVTNNTSNAMTVSISGAGPCSGSPMAPNGSCTVRIPEPTSDSGAGTDYEVGIAGTAGGITYTSQMDVEILNPIWPDAIMKLVANAATQDQTVRAGDTALYTLQVAPLSGVFPSAVSFAATGLPAGSIATFSPATLAANSSGQTVIFAVKTATTQANLAPADSPRHLSPILLGFLLLPLAIARKKRKPLRSLAFALAMFGALVSFTGLIGCSSSSAASKMVASSPTTSTITITATMGKSTQSTTVTLTVQ